MFYVLLLTVAAVAAPSYEWRSFNDGSQEYALMENGHQIGSYNGDKGIYRPYDRANDKWLPACSPPIDPPYRNYGVRLSATEKGTHYRRSGSEVSQEEADAALSGVSPLASDSAGKRLHVVVIGPAEKTKPVIDAFESNGDLKALKQDCFVQSFRPDDWQVSRSGYVCDGQPTIYLLDNGGKVLYRRDDFECGPDGLAEALRDADPDYKPESDPGPSSAMPDVSDPAMVFTLGALLSFAVALVLFVWGFRRWRMQ